MRKLLQKKSFYLLLALLLAALCFAVFLLFGKTYTAKLPLSNFYRASEFDIDNVTVSINDPSVVEVEDYYLDGGDVCVVVKPLNKGKTSVYLTSNDVFLGFRAYVHPFGQITYEDYFGDFTGSFVLPIAFMIFLVFAFCGSLMKYRAQLSRCMYRYDNITTLGMTIFLGFLIVQQILIYRGSSGLYSMVYNLIGSAQRLSFYLFPAAFIVSLMVMASNINLMIKEGFSIRNAVGTLLGAFICFITFLPDILYGFMLRNNILDIGRETGIGRHIIMFSDSSISGVLAYIECILIATIILALMAARHVPAFDKDYILILGCKINKDGTLTKLLSGRADRALDLARMQKEASGKDVVFVPSGGQGSDEVISEAEAVKNYLLEKGVPEERILTEDKSVNTFENIRNSVELIREHSKGQDSKIAYSTTNYHVFRAGLLACEQGQKMEGIGSKTKRYFWVNAFVREFIATLYSERRHTLKIVALLIVLVLLIVFLMYLSINI